MRPPFISPRRLTVGVGARQRTLGRKHRKACSAQAVDHSLIRRSPTAWGHAPAHCSFALRVLQSARLLARLLQVDEPVRRALADEESDVQQLSPRWRYAVIVTFALGLAVLILLTFTAYQNAPPIPERVVDTAGAVVFTASDVHNGQEVFLKYGLMDNGTIWGHGGYLGPDFSAAVLHDWALALAQQVARTRYSRDYAA